MCFTASGGSKAKIMRRMDKDNWEIEFSLSDRVNSPRRTLSTELILQQIEDCKKGDALVSITYE